MHLPLPGSPGRWPLNQGLSAFMLLFYPCLEKTHWQEWIWQLFVTYRVFQKSSPP